MYKTAIVGCGAISKNHAEGILAAGAKLVCACDPNPQKLKEFCEKYSAAGYSDYDAMLQNEKLDAVHICTPHFVHFEQITAALDKGIAVLTEKPPVVNPWQMSVLKSYADKPLTVCFQNRYGFSTLQVQKIIESGEYGKFLGADASVCWNRKGEYYTESGWRGKKATEGGSVLINQAIHTLDLLCLLLGKPTLIGSDTFNVDHGYNDTEDTAFAVIGFGEKRATFFATTCGSTSSPAQITLIFEKGRVQFDTKGFTVFSKSAKTEHCNQNSVGKECWGSAHSVIIDKFYKMLGGGPNPCSIDSCSDTMDLLFKIYKEEIK